MQLKRIVEEYYKGDISLVTVASHSSLQLLHGAKKEGLRTILIVKSDRLKFYKNFKHLIDEFIIVNEWKEMLNKEIQEYLISKKAVAVPHGSFIEYIGAHSIVNEFKVPIFGGRKILLWESEQDKKMELLEKAGIKTPKRFSNPEEVDRPVIVKLGGAKGGRGYFIATSPEEVKKGLERLGLKDRNYIIQEYVIGVPAYFHIFNSKIMNRIEITGMDIRYESNVDGLRRLPPRILDKMGVMPSFTVIGNIPMVLRESLLIKVYDYAENFINATKEYVGEELVGPFCLESIVKDDGEIVVFEFSGRIVAGTNIYVNGSPYSYYYWDEPMSVGRRIAREIKIALQRGILADIVN